MQQYIQWFQDIDLSALAQVGGKNASLGEMIKHLANAGVQVPGGFATTAQAYQLFLEQSGLNKKIQQALANLDVNNINELTKTGAQIRQWILETPLMLDLQDAITTAYVQLQKQYGKEISVAVRSSATAEDLPEASFAGQQETFLNVNGIDNILTAIKHVFASLFNDRAIAYRVHNNFAHEQVALSAGIQRMVRSDVGASGVMFTLDTESGFQDVIFITSSYGLGETVVQGSVNPDEFYVYKPNLIKNKSAILRRNLGSKLIKMTYTTNKGHGLTTQTIDNTESDRLRFSLSDDEVMFLAQQAMLIEKHYKRPMDIEWAKDGIDNKIYILQARPETVKSRNNPQSSERYQLKEHSEILVEGRSIGQRIGNGTARVVTQLSEMDKVQKGDVLVADMTDPDWEPIMKRAAAIVTNRGGRTCHAAIIARELGIPAVVGCGDATQKIQDGAKITVSCAEGDTGYVYKGLMDFAVLRSDISELPKLPFKIMLNVGNPERAFNFRSIPNTGVGLARLEFIISQMIGVHPKALLNFADLPTDIKKAVQQKIACYANPVDFYIEKLTEGIATIAAAFYPHRVIVRLSDFKSNEYANLIGGHLYEPTEENPMLGFRGASRYIASSFRDCFILECKAMRKVRDEMGFTNVEVMIPFVRTVNEAKQVIDLLAEQGLKRGVNDLKIIMMCEIPSNALLAEDFLKYFDGFSIGSNDLTQLTLGLDRDSGIIAGLFDERNPAVKVLLSQAIRACKKNKKYIGICGQGPSDHPDLAKWLMEEGIDSVSLNPDSVIDTILFLAGKK